MFEDLKRTQLTTTHKRKSATKVLFVLFFDDYGAYVEVCDQKLFPVEVDPELYTHHERRLLMTLEELKLSQLFKIQWESDSSRLYLRDHESLLEQLALVDDVVDENGSPLLFEQGTQTLNIVLHEVEGVMTPVFSVGAGSRWLTQGTVLKGNTIVTVVAIGEYFDKITQFQNTFPVTFLEQYLSLLFTFFEAFTLTYAQYEIVEREGIMMEDALVIDDVDAEGVLYLKVLKFIENVDIDFLNSYDLETIVFVNAIERQIMVHPLERDEHDALSPTLSRLLNRHKKTSGGGFFIDEQHFVVEPLLATAFLKQEMPTLLSKYRLIGSAKLKEYKIKTLTPKLSLTKLSSGIDFLQSSATLDIDGETFGLYDAISMFKKKGYIELSSGENVIVQKEYFQKLERLIKKDKKETKISFFDLPQIEALIENHGESELFKSSKAIYEGFNTLGDLKKRVPKLNAKMREYQEYGFHWLKYLYDNKMGGCLADDMGLGKTLQSIALLSAILPKAKNPVLVVLPKSLIYNWQKELEKFSPEIDFSLYYGGERDFVEALKAPLVLTSYAMVRNDIEKFREITFDTVILDESQAIKNYNAQTTKAVLLLKAEHRFALSGTPIENSLSELFVLFKFLNPSMFYSAQDFNRYYLTPIQKEGNKEAMEELRRKIYPFILRRLKSEVAKDLPEKIEQVLYVEMGEEQAKLYESRRAYYDEAIKTQVHQEGIEKSQFFILQALSELRQIATNPEAKSEEMIAASKREVMMDSLLEAVSNDHKVLIFTNFLNALEQIKSELEKLDIGHVSMSGATSNRQILVDKFQNDPSCKVFAMTLKVGGVGLNLTAADVVYIYDPWWNKTAEDQAIDRTHRIGQKNRVSAYKLISKNSIEEKILQLQEQKSAIFEKLIGSDSASVKSLGEDDIAFLLGT